jgi:Holliday junction DNA helicase RuvA
VIAFLSGTLLQKDVQRIVVNVGGVGYDVHVPLSTLYGLGEPGAPVSVHVHTHVREDALQLFGFATTSELMLFERLIGISGIGPKLALAVLSGIEPGELVRAIRHGDVGRLTRIPGVGKKTAERIVIELRDRLPAELAGERPADAASEVRGDVLSALANLGYQRATTEKALDRVLARSAEHGFETLLREVLKELAK